MSEFTSEELAYDHAAVAFGIAIKPRHGYLTIRSFLIVTLILLLSNIAYNVFTYTIAHGQIGYSILTFVIWFAGFPGAYAAFYRYGVEMQLFRTVVYISVTIVGVVVTGFSMSHLFGDLLGGNMRGVLIDSAGIVIGIIYLTIVGLILTAKPRR